MKKVLFVCISLLVFVSHAQGLVIERPPWWPDPYPFPNPYPDPYPIPEPDIFIKLSPGDVPESFNSLSTYFCLFETRIDFDWPSYMKPKPPKSGDARCMTIALANAMSYLDQRNQFDNNSHSPVIPESYNSPSQWRDDFVSGAADLNVWQELTIGKKKVDDTKEVKGLSHSDMLGPGENGEHSYVDMERAIKYWNTDIIKTNDTKYKFVYSNENNATKVPSFIYNQLHTPLSQQEVPLLLFEAEEGGGHWVTVNSITGNGQDQITITFFDPNQLSYHIEREKITFDLQLDGSWTGEYIITAPNKETPDIIETTTHTITIQEAASLGLAPIPEPATMSLLALGTITLMCRRRARSQPQ